MAKRKQTGDENTKAEQVALPTDLQPFSTRLSAELKKRLRVFAAMNDRSMSDVLHVALSEYLDRNGG